MATRVERMSTSLPGIDYCLASGFDSEVIFTLSPLVKRRYIIIGYQTKKCSVSKLWTIKADGPIVLFKS